MWINRDIQKTWLKDSSLEARILVGPRQCGKSALLDQLAPESWSRLTLDDIQLRQQALHDPALFFEQFKFPAMPMIVDEMQYAPPLFPELKRRIDEFRANRRRDKRFAAPILWATGSNQVYIDKHVKESLAGRASYYRLHPLSVAEIHDAFPDRSVEDFLARGGWPELYVNEALSPTRYLNDYVRNYIERDVVLAAGVQKVNAFDKVLGLVAARTGSLLSLSDIATPAGVEVSTVADWISIMERTGLVMRLSPYFNNLNKRLIKTPKIHVIDPALAARLQGWTAMEPLLLSPQIGGIFESTVVGEVVKARDNFLKDWRLHYWRTKEGDEVDLLVEAAGGVFVAIEVKSAVHDVATAFPKAIAKDIPNLAHRWVVTRGGKRRQIDKDTWQVPIVALRDELLGTLP